MRPRSRSHEMQKLLNDTFSNVNSVNRPVLLSYKYRVIITACAGIAWIRELYTRSDTTQNSCAGSLGSLSNSLDLNLRSVFERPTAVHKRCLVDCVPPFPRCDKADWLRVSPRRRPAKPRRRQQRRPAASICLPVRRSFFFRSCWARQALCLAPPSLSSRRPIFTRDCNRQTQPSSS